MLHEIGGSMSDKQARLRPPDPKVKAGLASLARAAVMPCGAKYASKL